MKHKCITGLLLLLFLGLLLVACNKSPRETEEKGEKITLYYINSTGNGLVPVPSLLDNKKDTEEKAEEILDKLAESDEESEIEYSPSIYDGVIIRSVSMEDGTVNIDFESNYRKLDPEKEILLRASVVRSLLELPGVESVSFTVGEESLLDSDDQVIGPMTEDSFIMDRKGLYSRREKVSLYFANNKGDGLVEVKRYIEVDNNMPVEAGMIQELITGKIPEGTRNPLPPGLKVNKTQIYNNICYVDLSEDILEILPDIKEEVKVYSMVDTLVDSGDVSQVQFTVNGRPVKTLNDIENFDQPFSFDYSLAGKKEIKKEKKNKKKKD